MRRVAGDVLDLSTPTSASRPSRRGSPSFRPTGNGSSSATEVMQFLAGGGTGPTARRELPNVGTLSRITVSAVRLRQANDAPTLQARLREASGPAGPGGPERLSLLTSAQLAALKPAFVVRDWASFRRSLFLHAGLMIVAFLVVASVRFARGASGAPALVPAVFALTGIGFVLMVSLRDPLRDVQLFAPFAQGVAAGCVALLAVTFVDLERSVLPRLSYVPLLAALVLSALLVTLGSGPAGSDARVNLFGVQPVDAIRLLVTLFLAGYFAQRWELLRELRDTVGEGRWSRLLHVPRRQEAVPLLAGILVVLFGFFLQKDLGPALMVACVFLAMYGIARNRWLGAVGGLALLASGFVLGQYLRISSTLAARVQIRRSPWDNGARGGDQVAQALWALASGGWKGTGLGHGMPEIVPAAHTDLVLTAAAEQLGLAGLAAITLLFAAVCTSGFRIAARARGEYSSLLAAGLTVGLIVPVLLISGGFLGLLPLTGVVSPFLSYGRSALVANLAAVGLLLSIADRAGDTETQIPFFAGIRRLQWVVAGIGIVTVMAAARVQTIAADEVMAAGALTRQGDGIRRFSYNPRLLATADRIVRGTITDRNGLPVATSQPDLIAASAAKLAPLGIKVTPACVEATGRCYPFGGPLFHVVGDVIARVNWAASNTSFVERDRDARLRGYDDLARVVEVVDPSDGSRSRAIQRNLSALLPLWRHRDEPDHPEVKALLERPRDVRLTLDARLQWRVAELLEARVTAAHQQHGAAVVIDAATGDVLASVSYPWPEAPVSRRSPRAPQSADDTADRLLDRARYGLYAPGSTFKLVTATAVLRSAPNLAGEPLVCRRLDDGRIGNVVRGWRHPVRDDVNDTVPHGDVTLERGIVRSCNAYFAQLGARLGGGPLRETAALFDIQLTRGSAAERLRDTLPFASYGQGEVLATPYRMARVAASIAADGLLAPPRTFLEEGPVATAAVRVLDAPAARRLAAAMREVVTSGTGRGLLAHPEQVAGKTGTAEVEGAPSHSWFVGFAPYGGTSASRTIAFAVIIEHGGYGGRAAAPLAGEIVTAARDLGVLGPAACAAAVTRALAGDLNPRYRWSGAHLPSVVVHRSRPTPPDETRPGTRGQSERSTERP